MSKEMEKAKSEVKLALASEKHRYLSEETLQLCLEAINNVIKTEHNGYPNYETWLVANRTFNEEETYYFFSKLKQELRKEGESDQNAIGVIAQTMRNYFETESMKLQEFCNESFGNANFWSSIINAAQQEDIKYWTVAKSFYED